MLNQLAKNIWECPQALRFVGAEIGCRMTCVRLQSGDVVVHSPIRGSEPLYAEVEKLGRVRWLVAPNAFHHLFVKAWWERFPEATALVAPKLHKKRPDLANAPTLADIPSTWGDELQAIAIAGLPTIDEHVFFHRPSATLILTDLAFHFGRDSPFLTRWMIRLTGRLGKLAPTLLERLLVRNRKQFKASLEQVLEWPFERVVVSHGEILESKTARDALAEGYDWLGVAT